MTVKRVLFIVAAVCFALAWLVGIGAIDSTEELITWQALVAAGLCFTAVGHAA